MNEITFHTFRHFKATMEAHRGTSLVRIQEILGHRSILSTSMYIHLAQNLFGETDYTSEVATNIEQARKLLEAGFDYVCEIDGSKLFRKRK
jgi:hypothetical protein